MNAPESPAPRQMQLLIWESDVIHDTTPAGESRATVVARRPLSHMSAKQAAQVLGVSVWTVGNLYQLGLLDGYKPGARVKRRDGKASNAALRLDSGSVLAYKQARLADARAERS